MLIKMTAGLVFPLACKVNNTTKPATGHAASKTVVTIGIPWIPITQRIIKLTNGKIKLRKSSATVKEPVSLISFNLSPTKLLPITIIEIGVKA